MQTVLLTGASGFIGANLARRLLQDNVEVHAMIRAQSDLWRLQGLLSHLHLHRVDLEDFETLEKLIQQISPSVIFHLAAHGVMKTHRDRALILRSNIIGTYNLLTAAQQIDYQCLIHMGGSSEYGKKDRPMSENDQLQPTTFYGLSKACSTLLAEQFANEFNQPITILRAFSVYGPYESPTRLIPRAIDAALSGKSIHLTAPGLSRDYIHVDDVVDACLVACKKRHRGEVFNIGTGTQTTNEQVIALIEKQMGRKISILDQLYPPHLSDHTHWVADPLKTEKLLNWKPKYSLEKGLRNTISHYESINQHCPSGL